MLINDAATMSLLTAWATTPVVAAITGFAFAPLWGADPWIAGAAIFVGASLLVSPLIVRKIRWLSRISTDGVLVEATREGWGKLLPLIAKLSLEPSVSVPRYAYTYLGTVHHILWSNYFTREPPGRLRVLVDRDRPERAVALGAFAEDPLPNSRIPPISTHIGPWLDRLDPGVKGCGCSLLIFLLALGVTGYGFGPSSLPPGSAFNAWVFVGLASPVVGVFYLLWRLVTRR